MGPNYSISTACATANYAFVAAANHIRRGEAEIMLVGGSEAPIIPVGLGGFVACRRASAPHACGVHVLTCMMSVRVAAQGEFALVIRLWADSAQPARTAWRQCVGAEFDQMWRASTDRCRLSLYMKTMP